MSGPVDVEAFERVYVSPKVALLRVRGRAAGGAGAAVLLVGDGNAERRFAALPDHPAPGGAGGWRATFCTPPRVATGPGLDYALEMEGARVALPAPRQTAAVEETVGHEAATDESPDAGDALADARREIALLREAAAFAAVVPDLEEEIRGLRAELEARSEPPPAPLSEGQARHLATLERALNERNAELGAVRAEAERLRRALAERPV